MLVVRRARYVSPAARFEVRVVDATRCHWLVLQKGSVGRFVVRLFLRKPKIFFWLFRRPFPPLVLLLAFFCNPSCRTFLDNSFSTLTRCTGRWRWNVDCGPRPIGLGLDQ